MTYPYPIFPPDAEVGQTNLTCPLCKERIGVVQLLRHLQQLGTSPEYISPNSYSNCPNSRGWYFPENAFLQCLREISDTGESYRGYPFGIAGSQGDNFTHINVGETRETNLNNLYQGYEIEGGSLMIRGAERTDADDDEPLPIDRHEGSYTRVTLAEELLVSIAKVAPRKVLISANLRGDRPDDGEIMEDDEITLIYRQNLFQAAAIDPPWILLLREAKTAINQGNPLAAAPLLVSAVDNGLFRQVYLYFRRDGLDHQTASDRVRRYGHQGRVRREDIARDALEDISGVRLTEHQGPYYEEWDEFLSLVNHRIDIVHPTDEPIQEVNTETAVDWLNLSVDLLLGLYDLVWFHEN